MSLTVGSDRQRLIFWTLLNKVDIRHQHARATLRGFAFMNILRLPVCLHAAPAATSRFLHDKRFSPFSLGATFRAGCRHISIISPRRDAVKALTPAVPSQIPEGGGGGGGEGSGSGGGGGFRGGGGDGGGGGSGS